MTKPEPEFWAVVPVLATKDVMQTAAYYRDILGFAIDDTFSGPEWTMLWADQCQLFLTLNPPAAETAKGQQVMICVPGVDAMYERHKAEGANIISDIEDKPWDFENTRWKIRTATICASKRISKRNICLGKQSKRRRLGTVVDDTSNRNPVEFMDARQCIDCQQ